MGKEVKHFRNEIKILLSYADYLLLSARLAPVLDRDCNANIDGEYFIRSIYFDDIYETAYSDKLAGIRDRKKYRIRFYDFKTEIIKLECKEKNRDKIFKRSLSISLKCASEIINGDFSCLEGIDDSLAQEFYLYANSSRLRPSVVVDYHREAYVHPLSNVRLTFDKHLYACGIDGDLFSDEIISYSVFNSDMVIFEVKYDEFIPKFISQLISHSGVSKKALSKFCLCKNKITEVCTNERV